MEKTYAQALQRSLANGADEKKLVDGLIAHLTREGRMKLLPLILRELKNMQQAELKTAPHLEVASEGVRATALKEAQQEGIETDQVTVNPDLISGWRAVSAGKLVDRSGKQALVELYRNIVTH